MPDSSAHYKSGHVGFGAMILTCPSCAARFMIDDRALGSSGRTVRCGACGHSWHQFPEAAPSPAMAQAGAPAASTAPPNAAGPVRDDAKAEDRKKPLRGWRGRREAQPEAAAAAANAADAAARDVAATADAEGARGRRGASRVLVWFLFVFVVAAIPLGGYRFRNDIVRIWPPAAMIYDFLSIDLDSATGHGLKVPQDSLRFRREAEGGVPILVVSGEIANESKKSQRVTPMRIALLDKDSRILRTERVKIDDRVLDPGKRIPFQTSIPNYPPETTAVRISFDVSG